MRHSKDFRKVYDETMPDAGGFRDVAEVGWSLAMRYVAAFFRVRVESDGSLTLLLNQDQKGERSGDLLLELMRHGLVIPGLTEDDLIARMKD